MKVIRVEKRKIADKTADMLFEKVLFSLRQ